MTMSDPIADMLTRIRNANTAKHDTVDVPSSKMKLAIADILVKEGFIKKYDVVEDGNFKTIRITLKYGKDKNEKIISGIKRISKPGLRIYANKEDMPMSSMSRSPALCLRFLRLSCSSAISSSAFFLPPMLTNPSRQPWLWVIRWKL